MSIDFREDRDPELVRQVNEYHRQQRAKMTDADLQRLAEADEDERFLNPHGC